MAAKKKTLDELMQEPGTIRPVYNVSDIVAKIQNQRITVVANKSGVFPGSDERYYWATEDKIMEKLAPMIQENNLQVLFGFVTDGPIGMMSMVVRVIGAGDYAETFSRLPIGEIKSNIDFTARCTTIRRDMLAMTFGVVVVPPPVNDTPPVVPTVPAATLTEAQKDVELPKEKDLFGGEIAWSPAFKTTSSMIAAAPTADNLVLIKTQVTNSVKLADFEKEILLADIQKKYEPLGK